MGDLSIQNLVVEYYSGGYALRPINGLNLDVALPDDLVYLSRHGFTSTEVLTGATAAAAASCGLGHRKGRIAPGYDADLLAVAAGVDHDPAGLCDVKAVWRSGTQVPLQASAVGYNTPS